jgi:hypothetical protein
MNLHPIQLHRFIEAVKAARAKGFKPLHLKRYQTAARDLCCSQGTVSLEMRPDGPDSPPVFLFICDEHGVDPEFVGLVEQATKSRNMDSLMSTLWTYLWGKVQKGPDFKKPDQGLKAADPKTGFVFRPLG